MALGNVWKSNDENLWFFFRLSRLVTPYNIGLKIFHLRNDFCTILYWVTKRLSRIKKNHKFSSLLFQTLPNAKCHKCYKPFSYFGFGFLVYIQEINFHSSLFNNTVWDFFCISSRWWGPFANDETEQCLASWRSIQELHSLDV